MVAQRGIGVADARLSYHFCLPRRVKPGSGSAERCRRFEYRRGLPLCLAALGGGRGVVAQSGVGGPNTAVAYHFGLWRWVVGREWERRAVSAVRMPPWSTTSACGAGCSAGSGSAERCRRSQCRHGLPLRSRPGPGSLAAVVEMLDVRHHHPGRAGLTRASGPARLASLRALTASPPAGLRLHTRPARAGLGLVTPPRR